MERLGAFPLPHKPSAWSGPANPTAALKILRNDPNLHPLPNQWQTNSAGGSDRMGKWEIYAGRKF